MKSKEIGKAIRAAREKLGMSQAALGEAVGIKQASVQAIEKGETARSKYLPQLARALAIKPEMIGLPSYENLSPPAFAQEVYPVGGTEPILRRPGARTLPVLGITMGGDTDYDPDRPADFWMNGEVINYVARPRSLENAKDAFALYVDGTSMLPRYRAKDMVVVQKVAPTSGDDVVIELKPRTETDEGSNPSFLKEFVRRAGRSIIVKQYNPEKEITFDLKEIKNVFRVISVRELMS
jgi:phage repressor protein C with HTH and peptisase S24 domain